MPFYAETVREQVSAAWPESVIATHSGLRGRPGRDLTPAVIRRAIEGFAALLEGRGAPPSIGVGRDGRPAGRRLVRDVIEMATGAGLDVFDFGTVSTPTVKLAARLRGLGGAVVVTASHLGPKWNGLKLAAGPDYVPVDLRRLPAPGSGASPLPGEVHVDPDAVGDHAEVLLASAQADAVRAAGLQVEWSGGVGPLAGIVLDRLGCTADGSGSDLRLLLDADGDRLQLADERGEWLDSEVVLPLVALAREAGTVVKGADTSRMVDDVTAGQGGHVHVVTPGELHLLEAVSEQGAELAGEGNGGVVVPAVGMARDALAAAIAVLELCATSGQPLSRLAGQLPRYARRRSTFPCDGQEAGRALDSLARAIDVDAPDDPEVGVRIERGRAWGLVRRSATEPVLRVTVEAPTAEAAERLHAELVGYLAERVEA
jgi:phosphomannomutase